MADEYFSFDNDSIDAALEAARQHYDTPAIRERAAPASLADDGHLRLAAQCIAVKVSNGKVCLDLPLGIGKFCLPIPRSIPNGTAAQACLKICTTWGIPTGVKVTISAGGHEIISKSFGNC